MICPTCKRAGDHNTNGDYKGASKWHKKCEWASGGCFCQHAVGEVYVGRIA